MFILYLKELPAGKVKNVVSATLQDKKQHRKLGFFAHARILQILLRFRYPGLFSLPCPIPGRAVAMTFGGAGWAVIRTPRNRISATVMLRIRLSMGNTSLSGKV